MRIYGVTGDELSFRLGVHDGFGDEQNIVQGGIVRALPLGDSIGLWSGEAAKGIRDEVVFSRQVMNLKAELR